MDTELIVALLQMTGAACGAGLGVLRLLRWVKDKHKTQRKSTDEPSSDGIEDGTMYKSPLSEEVHKEVWRDWHIQQVCEMREQGTPEWRLNMFRIFSVLDLFKGLILIRIASLLYSWSRPRR